MLTKNVDTARDMRALGENLAALLRGGEVLLLTGEMGAGKSEFCRGLARGLGIAGPVPSPTFTILNVYEEGRLPLHHFDWYRVTGPEELLESGLDEQIEGDFVSAVEWHERAPELLPERCLEVAIEKAGEEDGRRVSFIRRGGFELPGLDKLTEEKTL